MTNKNNETKKGITKKTTTREALTELKKMEDVLMGVTLNAKGNKILDEVVEIITAPKNVTSLVMSKVLQAAIDYIDGMSLKPVETETKKTSLKKKEKTAQPKTKKAETKKDAEPKKEKFEFISEIKTDAGIYKRSNDELIDFETVNLDDYLIATKWTKKDLESFEYGVVDAESPASFKDDVDINAIVHITANNKKVYCISLETEKMIYILASDLKKKSSNGLAFQFYKKA